MAASISSDGEVPSDYAEILVIRHAQTEWNVVKRIQGHLHVELSDVGRLQVAAVSARLSKGPKISAVYSSDLRRAHETAHMIASNCGGLEVIKDPHLRERNKGDLQGVLYHEAAKFNPQAHQAILSRSKDQEILGGGESLNQLYERSTSCLQRIGEKHKGERVVVVTHGGVMRALHRHADPHKRAAKVFNTSVNVFHLFDGDEWIIKVWGDVSHLNNTGFLESGLGGDQNSG